MAERQIPSDLAAEQAVLGAMLLSENAVEVAGRLLTPEDFYRPAHGHIYAAVQRLYATGQPVDTITVSAALADDGVLDSIGGPAALVSIAALTPVVRNAAAYATRVIDRANARRIIQAAHDAIAAIEDGGSPADVGEGLCGAVSALDGGDLDVPVTDVVDFHEWVSTAEADSSPFVIPGVLRQEHRLLLTAPAGAGKATLLRQMAYAPTVGVHPFLTDRSIPPVRTMIVDLENPQSAVEETGRRMIQQANKHTTLGSDHERCAVWSQIGGINLLDRADRLALERRIRHVRPQLVFLGPLYKSFRKDSKRSADEVVEEVCSILDDLRTRYSFALLLEHHSPRGSEQLFPFGSSVWERWPEFGRTLRPKKDDETTLIHGSFRRDRVKVEWPSTFVWSHAWPFAANYIDPDVSSPPAGS